MTRNDLTRALVWSIVGGVFLSLSFACESKQSKQEAGESGARLETPRLTDGTRAGKLAEGARREVQPLETIQGIIYISGNEPFVNLALEGLDGKVYYLTGEKNDELSRLQNRMVRVTGYLHPGRSAGGGRDTVEVVGFEVVHSEGE